MGTLRGGYHVDGHEQQYGVVLRIFLGLYFFQCLNIEEDTICNLQLSFGSWISWISWISWVEKRKPWIDIFDVVDSNALWLNG